MCSKFEVDSAYLDTTSEDVSRVGEVILLFLSLFTEDDDLFK